VATSIADLIDAIELELASDESVAVDDAASALMQAHRVLRILCREGLATRGDAEREAAANGLATMCRVVGEMWPQNAGRVAALTGVLGDAVGRLHHELTQSDRWATAIRLGPIVRKCVVTIEESGPYARLPELATIKRSTSNLRRCATMHPPDPERCLGIVRPIPGISVAETIGLAESVHESIAEILDQLNLRGGSHVGVQQAIGVCRAAESLSGTVERLGLDAVQPDATRGWRSAAEQLARFGDGRRPTVGDRLLTWAIRVHEALVQLRPEEPGELTSADIASLRKAASALPAVAESLDIHLSARRSSLIVPVGLRPLREGRVGEWLTKKPFMANRDDFAEVHRALRRAARPMMAVDTPTFNVRSIRAASTELGP